MTADYRISTGPFASLYAALKSGQISRRRFVESATALGMTAAGAAFLVNGAAAQDAATAEASPAAASAIPSAGTEGQTRGSGGDLRLLQWQAPSHLSPHVATGDKDNLAAQLVLEPLMHFLPDGSFAANLITEVPTHENGLLAQDGTSVTFKLLPGVTWSDGEPFTAQDVVFTWQWVMDPANESINSGLYATIKSIEASDDTTAVVTFNNPNPLWYEPFTGTGNGSVYPAHILRDGGEDANNAFRQKPIGTGPYVVESFSPNDQATYVPNEKYREPTKPFFNKVLLKGGGDAASAARAVIQTGEYDFAWYVQVEPELLNSMQSDNSPGKLIIYPGVYAERLYLNFSDPDTEVDGQRSHVGTPNPRLGDAAVRAAMATAIDRDKIAGELFFKDQGEPAGRNVISGIPLLDSPNTSWEYNADKANQILDDAGWEKDGKTRKKDGVELKLSYATTVNQVRQKIQAIVKKNLEQIGIGVDLMQIDAGIYFDSAAGNDQNTGHMYYDMNMHQIGATSPTPLTYMEGWYAGPDNENVAQKENGWSKTDQQRYVNPEYDALFEQAQTEVDPEKLRQLFIQMNDILINDHAVIPLVDVGEKTAAARWLNEENFGFGPFELVYWNIANWNGSRS
ncbi:MAG: peptide ABC transporter substrate-binding protein [Thermomicrobiales bacterium]